MRLLAFPLDDVLSYYHDRHRVEPVCSVLMLITRELG